MLVVVMFIMVGGGLDRTYNILAHLAYFSNLSTGVVAGTRNVPSVSIW